MRSTAVIGSSQSGKTLKKIYLQQKKKDLSGAPKKKKHLCSCNKEWKKKYTWLKPAAGDPKKAECSVCHRSFTIMRGEGDIRRHGDGESHKRNAQQRNANASMTSFFSPPKDSNQNKITAAEVSTIMCSMVLSYRSGDCTTKLPRSFSLIQK